MLLKVSLWAVLFAADYYVNASTKVTKHMCLLPMVLIRSRSAQLLQTWLLMKTL
jgi:hypothetical protein